MEYIKWFLNLLRNKLSSLSILDGVFSEDREKLDSLDSLFNEGFDLLAFHLVVE